MNLNEYQDKSFSFKDISLKKEVKEKKILILVVDDLKVTHNLVQFSLEENNFPDHEIISAGNGKEAYDLAIAKYPDIILMDVIMPIMNGFESCKKIKSNPNTSYIPIVMLTTLDDVQNRIQALKSGADDFLTKPFNSYELIARIYSLVQLKRYHEKLIYRNRAYEQELEVARRIQESILPKSSYKTDFIQIEIKSIPCLAVGGDYSNFYRFNDKKIAFFIADVVGHGIAPSLVTMALKIFFDRYAPISEDPVEFITKINQNLYGIFGELLIYVTAIYMVLDLENYSLELVNAGHPPALIFNFYAEEAIKKISSQNKMIGIFENYSYQKYACKLRKKDRIFLYTDGVFDIYNSRDKKNISMNDIKNFLEKQRTKDIKNFIPDLENYFYKYSQTNHFEDDINLLIIHL